MAWQDPTTINWSEGLGGAIYYVNSISLGWFSNMLLISIYVIALMGYYRSQSDFARGMGVAGAIVFIMGLFFFIAGMVNWIIFGITIAAAIIGFVVLVIDRHNN
jgi:hypothetical protein